MTAVRALRLIQIGEEATRGTEVPATVKLVAKDGSTFREVQEKATPGGGFGVLVPTVELSEIVRRQTEFNLTQDLSYLQVLYALHAGVRGNITPVEQTAMQSDYLWTFTPQASTDPAPDAFTLEYTEEDGSGVSVVQLTSAFALCSKLGISASQAAELATIESEWFARGPTSKAETAAIGLPTFGGGFVNGPQWQYSHATTFANLEAAPTLVQAQLIDFSWELDTGIMPKYRLDDDSPDFAAYQFGQREVTLSLTLDLGAEAESYRSGFLATEAIKYVRLKATGAQIGSGDTYSIVIDGAYELMEPFEMGGEQEGQSIVTVQLKGIYDKVKAAEFEIAVTNNQSTLP